MVAEKKEVAVWILDIKGSLGKISSIMLGNIKLIKFKSNFILFALLFYAVCFILPIKSVRIKAMTSDLSLDSNNNVVKALFVGQKVPEEFWNTKHLFYLNGDTVRKSLEEYKGKLLILDFWATWCAICWYQMKDHSDLISSYRNEVQILPVNPMSTKDTFANILETHLNRLKPLGMDMLETIYRDTLIFNYFPLKGYPKYVWISPNGYFIASTSRSSVSRGHIDGIMEAYR